MSDLRKAAQLALEFVTSEAWGKTPYMDVCVYEDAARLRDALRAALAQEQAEPAQEPVAQAMQDAAVYGVGISRAGKRIDPASIYEQPAQEPVAGAVLNADGRPVLVRNGMEDWYCKERNARRLYAAPQPQRPPLTDDEIYDCREQGYDNDELNSPFSFLEAARAIERKVRGE